MARGSLAWMLAAAALLSGGIALPSPATPVGDRPRFELVPGERYFRIGGQPAFVLGRNPAGTQVGAYEEHFRHAAAAGEQLMRVHFTYMPPGERAGEVDPRVLVAWDQILGLADRYGLGVLPVLGVWADWNDGSKAEPWHRWQANPFNVANGGVATQPGELLDDTPCRRRWLKRLQTLVGHWSRRRTIVGWEVFSEIDLVTGATEERAVRFAESAARVARSADAWKRPVILSQAGTNEWPALLRSRALDLISVHPYADGASGGRLDELILSCVRERLARYGKPVLLGECGLTAAPPRGTLAVDPRAVVGIRHAVWAAVVSGAMNGRMLWWEDGYDEFEGVDLCSLYHQVAAPAAAFVRGTDFTGFAPIACDLPPSLIGAVIGNSRVRLGWFRDALCVPPAWPATSLSYQAVSLPAPGPVWQAEFFDPATGRRIGHRRLAVRAGRLRVPLPTFAGSIATKLTRLSR